MAELVEQLVREHVKPVRNQVVFRQNRDDVLQLFLAQPTILLESVQGLWAASDQLSPDRIEDVLSKLCLNDILAQK